MRIAESDRDQARADVVEVIGRYVQLRKQGSSHLGLCPFHDDRNPSMSVSAERGTFKCFSCGKQGDAIAFVMEREGVSFVEAVEKILGRAPAPEAPATATVTPRQQQPRPLRDGDGEAVQPVPVDAPAPDLGHFRHGQPSSVWSYRKATGELLFHVVRFDTAGGRKQILPLTFRRFADGTARWDWKGLPSPRPLYALDQLATRPDAPVIVVEGEKVAEAVQRAIPAAVVTTWPNGSNADGQADWGPLRGRRVLVCPDNDDPGRQVAKRIAARLHAAGCAVKVLQVPEGKPDGWDLADAAAEGLNLAQLVREGARTYDPPTEAGPEKPDTGAGRDREWQPFLPLGYRENQLFFLEYRSKQVFAYTAAALTDNNLMTLAPLDYWETNYPSKEGFNRKHAVNALVAYCYNAGVYDPRRIRGRGAWRDNGRIVFHHGDGLMVDGTPADVMDIDSRYVYQIGLALVRPSQQKLTVEEARLIAGWPRHLNWIRPASARLLAGWMALAPICGALRWRPHIWLTGSAGSGKSTILDKYLAHLLGEVSLYAQGNSTEAGVRQALGQDALPVLFDETEQNDQREAMRVQNIISLIRQASTESGARTLKGTTGGDHIEFFVRSMFALASIQVGMKHQADYERLSVLSLRGVKDGTLDSAQARQTWDVAKDELATIHADRTIPGRFFRTVMDRAQRTLDDIETFASVGAEFFGNQRDGDQYGTLMAGYWSLVQPEAATREQARAEFEAVDWTDVVQNIAEDQNTRALDALMSLLVQTPDGTRMSMADIVEKLSDRFNMPSASDEQDLRRTLGWYGLRLEDDGLFVATNSENRTRALAHTPFATDLIGLLRRMPGVTPHGPVRLGGKLSRGIMIPLGQML